MARLSKGRSAFARAVAAGVAVLAGSQFSAQGAEWNGGAGLWGTASNWTPAVVPNGSTIDVNIDGGKAGNSAVTVESFYNVRDLTVDVGDALYVNGGTIGVHGTMTVNGQYGSPTARAQGPFFQPTAPLLTGTGAVYGRGMGAAGAPFLTIGPNLTVYATDSWGRTHLQGTMIMDVPGSYLSLQDGSTNSGTIQINGGFGGFNNFTNAATGVMTATNSSLDFQGGFTNAGSIQLNNSSARIAFASVKASDVQGITAGGGGTGVVNILASVDNTGNTLHAGANLKTYLRGNGGDFGTITGGTISATNGGTFYLAGGKIKDVTLRGDIQFDPTMPVINAQGTVTLDNQVWAVGNGGMYGGPQISFSGAGPHLLTGTGDITINGAVASIGGRYTNPLTIDTGITVRGGQGYVSSVVNYGTILTGSGDAKLMLIDVTNHGTITIAPGAEGSADKAQPGDAKAVLTQTAIGQTRIDGAFAAAVPLDVDGGVLAGGGSITLNNPATPTDFGVGTTVSPGAAAVANALAARGRSTPRAGAAPADVGTLSVSADNVIFKSGGHLLVDLSGAGDSDRLAVTGNLDLSTPDDWLDLNGAAALPGQAYVVATYTGQLSGQFDHVTGGFSVAYLPGQIMVTPVPEPGAAGLVTIGVGGWILRRRRRARRTGH